MIDILNDRLEFGYREVCELSSTDLQEILRQPDFVSLAYVAYRFAADGSIVWPAFEVLAIPSEGRIGIAAGADASWGDWDCSPDDLEQAISDYLSSDSDAWERRQ
jgi:hypothetical protein